MKVPELEAFERGELDEWWGGVRMVAKAFGMPLPALLIEVEEFAPGERRRGVAAGQPGGRSG